MKVTRKQLDDIVNHTVTVMFHTPAYDPDNTDQVDSVVCARIVEMFGDVMTGEHDLTYNQERRILIKARAAVTHRKNEEDWTSVMLDVLEVATA